MSAFLNNFNDPTTQRSHDPTIPPTAMTEETNMKAQSTSIHAPCSMLNAQSRKVRSGRRWTAAAAAWILAAGTLLGAFVVPQDARGDWLGNSYILVKKNSESSATWYNGSGGGNPSFPSDLGTLTALNIGGRVEFYDDAGNQWQSTVKMGYKIDSTSYDQALSYTGHYTGNNAQWVSGGNWDGPGVFSISISGLSAGTHTIEIWFQATDKNSNTTYDSNDSKNWKATFTIQKATPPSGESHDWTGSAITGVASGTGYSLSGTTSATAVGNYTATATLSSGYFWSDGTTAAKSISWSIVAVKPTIGTPTATSITTGGATLGAKVTANGGATITSYGVYCGTSANPTSGGYSNSGAPTTGTAFSKAVTGLSAGTLYHYRGFAVNSAGTSYTDDKTFTTLPKAPTIAMGTIGQTSIKFTVNKNSNGDATSYMYYFGTDPEGEPDTACTAGSEVTKNSGLVKGTTYYIRAVATAGGNSSSITHKETATTPGQPTITVNTTTSTSVKFTVGASGNGSATAYYYIIDQTSGTSVTTSDTAITAGTATTVTGLSAGQTYYIHVRAHTAGGYCTVKQESFTTPSGVVAPSITEEAKTIGTTSATLPITVNMGGGATTADITLKYSTTSGSYTTDATVSPLTLAANVTAGSVSGSMSDGSLSAGTAYYYQWSVANSAGTTTATGSFATEPTAPTFEFYSLGDSTTARFRLKRSNGYQTVVIVKKDGYPTWTPTDGVKVSKSANVACDGSADNQVATGEYVVYNGAGGGSGSWQNVNLTGLTAGSHYYARAYTYSRVGSDTAGGTFNYNTTSYGQANGWTLSTEPTWSTPTLTATAASASQINLSWGAASGASGYVVVRKNGSSASTTAPTDGTSYSTGSGLGGTIVYVGSATSYNNTSLSAGTTYSYTVWAYNGVSGTAVTYNYLTTGSATGTATTFASEPTGAPSLAVSARSTGSITLTVTKGTGASYTLVEAYTDGSHFADPEDGTAYSANAAYGSAGKVGSYAKAVLAGSDGSVEVTGLSAGTIYYFKAYAYNGDGSSVPPNYYATGSTAVSAYTIASEPTWGTPSLTAAASSASQIDLSWGAATGASGYLIVRKSGSTATTSEPADGSKYTAKSGETLIWVTSGSTTSKSDTGLSANTTYSYRIYAYKMTSGQDSTYNYLLGTELAKTATASDKTFAAKPTGAPSLSVNTRTVNSIKIDITKGANATYTLLEVYTDGSHFGTPVDGTTYSANAAWGSAGTVGSALAKVVCNDNSTSVTVTGLSAGTRYYFRAYSFNGNGSTTGKQSYYTTSYGSLDTAWTKPNAPTVGATVDGKTMIRLSATRNASGGTTGMVLVYGGSTAPTDGTAVPSKGASWAGGTVVWTGTANASGIEHVVASGTTHTYRLFAYAGSSTATAYSAAGTPASAPSTGSFGSEEIVDTFSYVSGSNLSGLNGEHGWSGAWAISGTGPMIVSQTGSSIPQFPNYSEYPDNTGNRIKIAMNSDAANFAATRQFPQVTSGKIFAAAIMSYHYAGVKKWCRIALQDGDTAKMAAGRVWESSDDKTIGIDDCNGSRTHGSFELNPWESGVNNDYLVIMRYDFSTKTISAKAYYHGAAVPTEEPSTWDVTKTLSANPSKLNKVSLQAGADTGGYTGDVYFDEVRVATSWTKLLAREATKPAAPTSFTVAADGYEMVRASVAAAAGNVIIVKNSNATFTAPTDGVEVTVGTTLGNGKVVYKGPVGNIEMVVPAGDTSRYGAYAYNADNYYSTMLASTPASLTMGAYPGSCYAAEAFAYTNETHLGTSTGSQAWMTGGKGWAGAWNLTGVPGDWAPGKAAKNASGVEGLLETTQLAGAGGNMLVLYPGTTLQSANKAALLKRELTTALAGGSTWWGMFTMKISTSASKSWAGMQLIDASGNVKASIGKLWDGTTAGIEGKNSGGTTVKGTSTYGVTADHSYVYIFKWDGSKMWLHVQHVASTSDPNFSSYSTPTFSDADDTSVSLSMADIKYVQLVAENGNSGDSGTCVGDTWFDEIRFGPSFSSLVGGSSTKPAAPTDLTSVVDGKEMVRLGWTKNGDSDVIVVATVTTDGTTPANPAAPVDNTSYVVGSTVGSTTPATKVLYKGGATEFEHVVLPGTKAKYAVYSDNGDNLYSSSGVSSGLKTVGTYAAGEYVETFSYTNGVAVADSGNSWKGGTACGANYWGSEGSGAWYARKPAQVPAGLTASVGNFPDSAGNVMAIESLGNNQNGALNRVAALPYGANGSGADNTMYFAYRMAYGYSGVNRWAGLKIRTYNDNVEYSVFVGKVGDSTEAGTLGIVAKAENGTEYKCWPLVGEGGTKFGLGGAGDSGGSGNTYLIVGKIRWTATGKANVYANAYWTGGSSPELPENEPEWSSAYWENAKVYGVNSIRLEAGSSDSGNTVGYAYFDELRFAGSWDELLAGKAPEAAWMRGLTPEGNPEVAKVYIGDTTTHYVYSQPAGAKQSAKVLIREEAATPTAATFVSYGIDAEFVRNYEDGSVAGQMDSEWKVDAQWTSTGTRYVWGSATGNGTTVNSTGSGDYAKDTFNVQALTAPTAFSAAADGGYRMTLAWTPYTDSASPARTFDEVIVLRYAGQAGYDAASGYPVPVDGTTYMAGDVITKNGHSATVVYRGPGGTYTDTGLTKAHQYYYAVHTVNNGYYSDRRKATGTTADQAAGDPVIDGKGNDWVGVPSATWNSSTLNEGEFIWTDKKADGRHNTDECLSADIGEFRVKANGTTVFFLLRLGTAAAAEKGKAVDLENTYVSVGIDTRRNEESTAMNWIGDESATVLGETYHATNAAIRYPERQMAVHYVAADDAWRIEMYAADGAQWYAPPTAGNATVAADVANGDYCVEWSVERADLNLAGEQTARFSVATFVNTKVWNENGKATADIDPGKSAAVDAMEIAPYGVNDPDANLGAWDEGLKDKKVNFWADVPFAASGLGSNTAPGEPTTADASGPGSPNLGWSKSTDGDGFVTGYLFELSETAADLSGLGGTTENGSVLYRVNLEGDETTSYRPKTTGTEFWWRVRARDNGGRLSSGTIRHYNVTGKKDNDGPEPNLLYVGTQVDDFLDDPDYRAEVEAEGDALAIVDSVYSEATPDKFGFVLEWTDASGVYATNRSGQSSYTATARYGTTAYATGRKDAYTLGDGEGAFTWNILSAQSDGTIFGRVSPNWDLMLVDTTHQATFNGPQGWTSGANVTNFVVETKTVDGTTYRTFTPTNNSGLGTVYYTIATGSGPKLKAGDIHWKYEERLELPTKSGGTEVTSGWTHVYDKDLPFLPSQTLWDSTTYGADANKEVPCITNFVTQAFDLPAYDPDVSLYLTVSAEDDNSVGASYEDTGWVKWPPDGDQVSYGYYPGGDTPESSGSCLNGPSKARNITTNRLIHIPVRDDDSAGPVASTAAWGSDAAWKPSFLALLAENPSASADWATLSESALPRLEGEGQNVTYQLTDAMLGEPLSMLFNVYDQHLSSGLKFGTAEKDSSKGDGSSTLGLRELTNTAFRARSWNATGYPYSAVESPGAANPQEQGWYVLSGGKYVPTEDTAVQPGTTYYTRSEDGWVTSAENRAGFNQSKSRIDRASGAGSADQHGLGTAENTVLAWNFGTMTEESLSGLFGVPNLFDYIGHHSTGATNLVQLHAWDVDNDREGDQAEAEITFGTLMLTDDDATEPMIANAALLGTGTNMVKFGEVAKAVWSGSGTDAFTGMQMGTAQVLEHAAVSGGGKTPAGATPSTTTLTWYGTAGGAGFEGQMTGATNDAGYRYIEWILKGTSDAAWLTDTLTFQNYVSAEGPTRFQLTRQDEVTEHTYKPGDLDGTGNEMYNWTIWKSGNDGARFSGDGEQMLVGLTDPAVTTAAVQTVAIPLEGISSGYIQYKAGPRQNKTNNRTLDLEVSVDNGQNWTTVTTHTPGSFGVDTGKYPSDPYKVNLEEITLDGGSALLPRSDNLLVRWYASGSLSTAVGFNLKEAQVYIANGVAAETTVAWVDVPKNESATTEGAYEATTTPVSIPFSMSMVNGSAKRTFRLYAYRATKDLADAEQAAVEEEAGRTPTFNGGSSATWAVNNLTLHGILSGPKGMEVTDEDLHHGAWTNRLEVMDGLPTGYDTAHSGLWLGQEGEGTEPVPQFTIFYPERKSGSAGNAFWTAEYTLGAYAPASLANVASEFTEASESSPWTLEGGASIVDGTTPSGKWLLLAGGDTSVGTATASLPVGSEAITERGLASVGVQAVARVRSVLAEGAEGAQNGFKVVVKYWSASDTQLGSTVETSFTANRAWKDYPVGPLTYSSPDVKRVTVGIEEAGTSGSGLQVDSFDISVAGYAGTEGAPADASTLNGAVKSAKLELHTPEAGAAVISGMQLSKEFLEDGEPETSKPVGAHYTLEARISDYDKDRTDDSLPGSSTASFWLYDDDEKEPQLGQQFGGSLGVRLGTAARQKSTGNGTSVAVTFTDRDMELNPSATAFLDLDAYDYSGWETTGLTIRHGAGNTPTEMYAKGGAANKLSGEVTSGAANVPSATNTFSRSVADWWAETWVQDEFKRASDATHYPAKVLADITDKDDDRAGDSLALSGQQVGLINFLDSDDKAPAFKSRGYELKQVFIGTNNVADAFAGVKMKVAGESETGWTAKGNYEVRVVTANDTAASRVQKIYDSELRNDAPFYIMANAGDPNARVTGQYGSGLQRGTESRFERVNGFEDPAFWVTNTTVVLANESAGSGGTAAGAVSVDVHANYNATYSSEQRTTRSQASVAPSTWLWPNGMTYEEVSALLPAAEETLDLRVKVEAWDADYNRAEDQLHTTLTGPTLRVVDDDTQAPTQPGEVTLKQGGTTMVMPESPDRDTVPWVRTTDGLSVEFARSVDNKGASDPWASGTAITTEGGVVTVGAVAGYRMAKSGVTPAPDAGDALASPTESEGTVSASLSTGVLKQGMTTYGLFAVDADADRAGDAKVSATRPVTVAYDCTLPTAVAVSTAEDHGTGASTDAVDDPTTQMDISWRNADSVGPDDPEGDKDNYDLIPTAVKEAAAAAGRKTTDILSPWRTYKVYYREYDPQDVESKATGGKSPEQVIYSEYINNASFGTEAAGWLAVTNDAPISDPSAGKTKYDTLGTVGTSSVRVYDLDFDREYLFVVVGVDKAGNEGPANALSWATNNTIKFAVTQGLVRASADIAADIPASGDTGMKPINPQAKRGAALYWMAAGQKDGVGKVSKEYDLIYRDAPSFTEEGDEGWNLVGTVKTNWNYQTDGLDTVDDNLRFFRASYKGRWQGEKPLASEEVYSMNNVVLSEGFNYVSLQGVPYTNTFAGVFGTDTGMWPPNATEPTSTNGAVVIEFYEPGTGVDVQAATKEQYFFASDGEWYSVTDTSTPVTDTLQDPDFFRRPFSINLPSGKKADGKDLPWWTEHNDTSITATKGTNRINAILWHPILQVPPTNEVVAAASASTSSLKPGSRDGTASGALVFSQSVTATKGVYNTLSLNLPVSVHPKQLRLVATNAAGVPQPGRMKAGNWVDADKLYVIDTATKEIREKSTMYCDAEGTWRYNKNRLEVTGTPIHPNDMLVLISAGGNGEKGATVDWVWTYSPTDFYKPPTRHMGR